MQNEPDLIRPPELALLNDLFGTFLLTNPLSSIAPAKEELGRYIIVEPWGDHSLELLIPVEPAALAATLNNVKLPQRLSAIWHTGENALEVIWTATNINGPQHEIIGRTFSFRFKDNEYKCQFGASSESVLIIADCLITQGPSTSFWRNLQSFQNFVHFKEHHDVLGLDEARSFWIRNLPNLTEDELVDLVTNLNFYLKYYDDKSPVVLVHDPRIESVKPRGRYIVNVFPDQINAPILDNNLVSFWNSADQNNPMLRYLIYYRVLEYAASMYVDSHVRSEVRRLLNRPDILSDKQKSVELLSMAIIKAKMDDSARLNAVMKETLDLRLIWRDVSSNKEFFARETKFEGGFSVSKLCSLNDTEDSFCSQNGMFLLSSTFRKIRNALSHGMDQETAGVITPTAYNQRLFLPWVHLIQTAAGEVVLNKDAT